MSDIINSIIQTGNIILATILIEPAIPLNPSKANTNANVINVIVQRSI